MEKKSVLFIHHGTVIGGAPVSLSMQVGGIVERGELSCTIACHSQEMRKYFQKRNIPTDVWVNPCTLFGKVLIRMSKIDNALSLFYITKDLCRFPFSVAMQTFLFSRRKEKIVHLNSAVLFSTAIAAKFSNKKIVWHIREGSLYPEYPKIIQKIILALADEIICISPVEASRLGRKNSKIHVIYNPVNFQQFDQLQYNSDNEKNRLGIPITAKVIVSFGGVVPRKGAKEILEALNECSEDTYAIIAGPPLKINSNDPYHIIIKELCKKLGEKRIIFSGVVENPASLLACADLLVFAGTEPHFPRPIFEAWAMKKPVVVLEMEGISNNVDNLINGIVVKEVSGKALGIAIRDIIDKKESLFEMGSAGYEKAYSMVSQEKSSKAVEKILSGINV